MPRRVNDFLIKIFGNKILVNNRSQKMGDGKFVIGLLIPLAISGVFYLFVRLFALDENLVMMWSDRFSNFPLYNNVMHYSPYPFEFFFFFSLSVLFVPLMVPYWWKVIPSHFRGKVRKSSKKFTLGLIGGLIFLISGFIFPMSLVSWFVAGGAKFTYLKCKNTY